MINDHDWTKSFYGVSHKVINGIQYTITDHETFAELMVFSWYSYLVLEKKYFFVQPFENDSVFDQNFYWNCGENYVQWAKHYVDHDYCPSITVNRMDMSKCYCIGVEG